MADNGLAPVAHLAELLLIGVFGGWIVARAVRSRELYWTWPLLALPVFLIIATFDEWIGWTLIAVSVFAMVRGARWHSWDKTDGADFAQRARERVGIFDAIRRHEATRKAAANGWVTTAGVVVGVDNTRMPVSVPFGHGEGRHVLVVGATGSGKTVTQTWIATRYIDQGHAAIVIDPKGDQGLRAHLKASAQQAGAEFLEWTPGGPCAYNPYSHGSESEIADKALAGENWTEPHYLRQAQRYLGHEVRALRTAGVPVTPRILLDHLDPGELDALSRRLDEQHEAELQKYLDSLSDRQKKDLAGTRDRLAILAESEVGKWLEPNGHHPSIDMLDAIDRRAVVYFNLESDRWPLLSAMLASAIVGDLITATSHYQHNPTNALVLIDEFSAVAPEQVVRLFVRGRSAGISMLLGTQELADLKPKGHETLHDQVLGTVNALIAHRQNLPASADLVSGISGTRAVWNTTHRVNHHRIGGPTVSGEGTRTRGYEYILHPGQIKQLRVGEAAVIVPGNGQEARIAAMYALTATGG